MPQHSAPPVERHCDVLVVGGSAAGLAAALQLGRQQRSVIVVDAGEPRNAPAQHLHGFLGREGTPPADLLSDGRNEVRSYGGEVLAGRVERVSRFDDGRFRAELASGNTVVARRVLAATGLVDELPDVDGLAPHWGRDVVSCPFCHGYEVRDRKVVQLLTSPTALHVVPLWRQLTARLVVVVGGDVDERELERLRAGGVQVVAGAADRVVAGPDGRLAAVELAGERLDADAVVVTPRFRVRAEPFLPLGLRLVAHPSGLGDVVETDAIGQTSVPGLYAAGNVTDPGLQVLPSAADGSRVGVAIAKSLAEEDLAAAARPAANQAEWDSRYSGEPLWSGNPNGTLVHEVSGLAPGRALDVGAGEGGDAFWLAEQGWHVTASDVSVRGLARIDAEARRRGVAVTCLHTDANARDAFPRAAFDLVSLAYASIPRTPDGRAVQNVLDAVAPGGTLLVLSHDIDAMRAPGHSRPFDPDAYVHVGDVAEALAGADGWQVEVHEKRPRPPGAATAAHHVDDVVLRARKR